MPPTLTQDDPTLETAPSPASTPASASATLLICLPAIPSDALAQTLETISAAFPNESVLIASPDPAPTQTPESLTLIPYPTDRSGLGWVLAASDYAAASRLAADHNATTILLLTEPPNPADAPTLRSLADNIRTNNVDLTVPRFHLGPSEGLVTSAILYPLSRALFGADIRFPLPAEAALSSRMAQRLASTAQRLATLNQGSSLLWPVAEAAVNGLSVREVDAPESSPPSPPADNFNALFTNVASSLFSDIESKASFWQRARILPTRPLAPPSPLAIEAATVSSEVLSTIESFHLAEANLQDIWSLVLPPQSRLALKRLSQLPPAAFTMDPNLWARIVYDFTLAFHLRTLNRSHLLGAMIPLYLAWVASHLRDVADDPDRASQPIQQTAAAFEAEKPYFVSRWRWPDRFNP
jgi:hypothetical protein